MLGGVFARDCRSGACSSIARRYRWGMALSSSGTMRGIDTVANYLVDGELLCMGSG